VPQGEGFVDFVELWIGVEGLVQGQLS
jgi:hypothetical protein